MKLITPSSLAREAASRWAEQYSSGRWGQDKIDIGDKLRSLFDSATPEKVNEIIGNKSWTSTMCNECGSVDVPVVEIGEPLDYESATAHACLKCLNDAVAALAKQNDIG